MKKITKEEINETIRELDQKTKLPVKYLHKKLSKEQPDIYDYVYQPKIYNEGEQGLVYSMVQIGWHIVKTVLKRNKKISRIFLEEQYDRNDLRQREFMAGSSPATGVMDILEELAQPNNQPDLITYLMEIMNDAIVFKPYNIRVEMITTIVTDVKTVIDCLILNEEDVLDEVRDSEFSEEKYEEIKKEIAGYIEEFKETESFMKLKDPQREQAGAVISAFGEIIYSCLYIIPADWKPKTAMDAIRIMLRDLPEGENFFRSVVPVMTEFLIFCDESGYVPEGREIARRLKAIIKELAEEANNPANWSIGKMLFKEAEAEGVDISSMDEMTEFLLKRRDELKAEKRQRRKKRKGGRISAPVM